MCAICFSVAAAACSPDREQVAQDDAADDQPADAQQAVLDAFDDHRIVGGFSASHGNKDVDDFLLALLRNPELPGKVDDIAVECGNALYQDVLDRYIAGEDVPVTEVQKVWRNTTGANCGFSTFYEQLFPLVRQINDDLPADQKLRVLACDPPLDWSQVDDEAEFERLSDRESSIAGVIGREVLEKDRKALLFFGINHVRHVPGTAVSMYEERGYEGVTYVIDDHHGFGNDDPALSADNGDLEARLADGPVPGILEVEGSWLGDLDAGYFNQPAGEEPTDPTGPPGVDAYLYVGARDHLLREPRSAQALSDEAYLAELEDRATRLGAPPESPRWPDNLRRMESQEGALLFDPDRDPGPGAAPAGS